MASAGDDRIRLLVDLQACQTESSANRGVGRYSQALFGALCEATGAAEPFAFVAAPLPKPAVVGRLPGNRILRLPELPDWGSERDYLGGSRDSLDAAAMSCFVSPLNADVVHISHAFEGYVERIAYPDARARAPGQLVTATLYDLIPLLYQDHYLRDEQFRKWYLWRLGWLRKADLLLAISECTRKDAIELLGIEPHRILTVHGGVAGHFAASKLDDAKRRALAREVGLRRERFVLYAGGDDHRKNLAGAIAGYARLPPELRRQCQLVVVCAMDDQRKQMYRDLARSRGLQPDEVVLTGYVPEETLVALYRACDAFVFPSLYEGLGLPVLEAMACGAPVIGGDNSSIRELIARRDALFDAGSDSALSETLGRVLSDVGFADDLRRHGLERAKQYSWEISAAKALEAIREALDRVRQHGVRSAICGWLPRKRLAVLTPLPPCRSGIADYSARFLPFLARHFDIDLYVDGYRVVDESLNAQFRIFDARDFEGAARAYDGILYEVGNSEFHAYMLPLLAKFPGVVGLHDAYLSGLLGYLDFNLGRTGSYVSAMLDAHGPRARRYFAPARAHPDPIGTTMVGLPGVKWVLDRALGVISHSPFNRTIASTNHPEGWKAPYRIIPQMVPLPRLCDDAVRIRERKALGFSPDSILIVTFGHVTWTKWGDRLLETMLKSNLRTDARVHLIFAGEMAKDAFGQKLETSIREAKLGERVRITGYLSQDDYERYLQICDIAIQLRTKSRGGTPKGVLDCMAHGVPVIVNDDASYRDYPDDVVLKLGQDPGIDEIATALGRLCRSPDERRRIGERGRHYVGAHHDPEDCAAQYAGAIHEFLERHRQTEASAGADCFAPHLASTGVPNAAVGSALRWIESVPHSAFRRPRLIIDVSHIARMDHGTGIQRVVKRVVDALYCSDRPGFDPVAVEIAGEALRPATNWLNARGLLVPQELTAHAASAPIAFSPGDVLLMLDSSWERYREFYPAFREARAAGVPIYTVVYDLLPLSLPPGNFVPGGKEWFEGWFREALRESDGLLCISRSVAEDVQRYIKAAGDPAHSPRVGFWHLGSDIATGAKKVAPSPIVTRLALGEFLLMVGTIEPRKSHAVALDAMERLWAAGGDLKLCIAGKEGWMVDDLMKRIREHAQFGKRLFLLEQTSDSDIHALYAEAAGVLCLSKGEGFGLPIVEAANCGTPVLCSDIPVFREVAGSFATYVDHTDARILAGQIESWRAAKSGAVLPDIRIMPRLNWEESAAALLTVVLDGNWMRGEA
jgi:glycosyltransferase involved in cell wall biosynthesis